jgi:hypothetical protein
MADALEDRDITGDNAQYRVIIYSSDSINEEEEQEGERE